jgi:hypothetical protein
MILHARRRERHTPAAMDHFGPTEQQPAVDGLGAEELDVQLVQGGVATWGQRGVDGCRHGIVSEQGDRTSLHVAHPLLHMPSGGEGHA